LGHLRLDVVLPNQLALPLIQFAPVRSHKPEPKAQNGSDSR
jgi:hypothetical protein